MLKQIEGSHAMAEAIALCRPEVICAYPITPQTHIVEGLGELVKDGSLVDCEYINVESEFAALSVAIGASAAGARAYTATASQGLLFMAEAVYNASGLGLADRDDARQPRHRRPHQYLERSFRRHVDARRRMAAVVCRDQSGGGRSAHPGVQARGRIVDAGHGLRRRLYSDPCDGAHRHSRPADRRRLSAALRSGAGARSRRAGLDRRHGRTGSLYRGPLPRALQADPGAKTHSGILRPVQEGVRPRLRRTASDLPHRGRRHACGRDGFGLRHHQGHHRRDARRRHCASASSPSCRSGPSRSRRCATRSPAPGTSS